MASFKDCLFVCLFVFFWVFCACLWLRGVCVSFALLLWLVGLVDDVCPFRASSILCCLVAVSSHDMHNEQQTTHKGNLTATHTRTLPLVFIHRATPTTHRWIVGHCPRHGGCDGAARCCCAAGQSKQAGAGAHHSLTAADSRQCVAWKTTASGQAGFLVPHGSLHPSAAARSLT